MKNDKDKSKRIFISSTLWNLWRWRDLCKTMTGASLRDTHANMFLGSLWWLLDPILMTAVYTLVIVIIRGRTSTIPAYPVFVMCGVLSWKQFSYSLQKSAASMSKSGNLIKTFLFPRAIIPVSMVFTSIVLFLISSIILCAATIFCQYVLKIDGVGLGRYLLLLPLSIMIQTILALGVSLHIAAIGVAFKDISNLLSHILRVGWFLSPGLYAVGFVVPTYKGFFASDWTKPATWYLLNPFVHIMGGLRDIVMFNRAPDWGGWGYCLVLGLLICWTGLCSFRAKEQRFIKEI